MHKKWSFIKRIVIYEIISIPPLEIKIVHFTVVCLVAKPLNRSEAKVDLVIIQTLLLFKCKLLCYHANQILFSITTRSPSSSLQIKGLATVHNCKMAYCTYVIPSNNMCHGRKGTHCFHSFSVSNEYLSHVGQLCFTNKVQTVKI